MFSLKRIKYTEINSTCFVQVPASHCSLRKLSNLDLFSCIAASLFNKRTWFLIAFNLAVSEQSSQYTRSSDTADRPRDAMCQSKFYQLLHNSVGTTCTTSTEQSEVMELEGYSRPTCNKPRASSHDALDRRTCDPQARPSTSFVDHTIDLPR